MEEMDSKPYQPLSKGRHEMEMSYTSSSDESEDGRAHHRSYTSRETLPDYTHELRLTLGSHRERQSSYTQPQPDLDFCKAGQMRSPDYHIHPQQQQQQQQHQEDEEEALCSGPAAHGHSRYSLGVGSDVDTEPEVDPSPAHGLQHMWMRGLKSEQSSCLTSRANSALSLTDTEHDRKSEPDNELPNSPGGQFTFRPLPPPPPPPHACTCARPAPYTQVSLQRKTMPTRCQASQGSQGADTSSSTDQAQLHNSWVLNSNIPLETRHFLFKQGSGSSALLSGAGQGYPLTSGTVYSPPPRPLPRSSVTRPLFTFNKPHRCCNWKCTALSASLLTLTLALLLTYVIEMAEPIQQLTSNNQGRSGREQIPFTLLARKEKCGEVLYEKRQYEKGHWACVTMREETYEQSICYGFMKLMRYICQQNSLDNYLGMTLPIVTVVHTNENHTVISNDVTVAYFLPIEHQAQPPQPHDNEIGIEVWPATTVYTRPFTGPTNEVTIVNQINAMAEGLDGVTVNDQFIVAGYTNPAHVNRQNEIWFLERC